MTISTNGPGETWGEVVLETVAEGLVRVSAAGVTDADDHLAGRIEVSGATVTVDVTLGNVLPTADVRDAFWAQTWLADVYGPEVAQAVVRLARDADASAVTLTAKRGSLSEPFVRLGVATWLHRWWPSGNRDLNLPFPVDLLELEIGALRWQAEAAFIERSPIERVLRPHLKLLHSAYDWNRYEHRGVGQDVVEQVLMTALRGAVDVVSPSTEGYQECANLLTAIEAGAQLTHDDWHQLANHLDAQSAAMAGVLRSGLDLGVQSPGSDGWTPGEPVPTTADLRDLPPRCLADVDGNVSWQVETSGSGTRLAVTALAAPAQLWTPVAGQLQARAYVDGAPQVFDLAWRGSDRPGQGAGVFHGRSALPPGLDVATASIQVGVFHPSWAGAARLSGAAFEDAARERAEITGLLVERHRRLDERLSDLARRNDPHQRPTAAEIVAGFRAG